MTSRPINRPNEERGLLSDPLGGGGQQPASPREIERALRKAEAGDVLEKSDALALIHAEGQDFAELLRLAGQCRDRGKGRTITFSKKVFLPLTNLCRDFCRYCAFRRSPGDADAHTMGPDEVREIVRAGQRLGCKEALFSLGDKPERAFPEMRRTLAALGHRTTMSYLAEMCRHVLEESSLLPHVNPGLMTEDDLARLKDVSVSMGLMLESVSLRLMKRGGPHFGAPDKHPARRLKTIEDAGRLRIPFTTGILIGIGETLEERIESLLALREVHHRYGHIQEIIIQNFRAKPHTAMHAHPEPTLEDLARTVAVARLLFGGAMNIQAPPNLVPSASEGRRLLLEAGINDWGGISPLTVDFINPERPWPRIEPLRREMREWGFDLRERLAVYPEFLTRSGFLVPSLALRARAMVDDRGLVPQEDTNERD